MQTRLKRRRKTQAHPGCDNLIAHVHMGQVKEVSQTDLGRLRIKVINPDSNIRSVVIDAEVFGDDCQLVLDKLAGCEAIVASKMMVVNDVPGSHYYLSDVVHVLSGKLEGKTWSRFTTKYR